MMRPFKDKRPIGPFLQTDNSCTVIIEDGELVEETDKIIEETLPSGTTIEYPAQESNVRLNDSCQYGPLFADINVDEDEFTRYNVDLGGEGVRSIGQISIIEEDDELFLSHFEVDNDFRGSIVSDILYSVFVGYAISIDANSISGSIGGGERTKSFFTKVGIPESDIKLVDRGYDSLSAVFESDLDDLDFNFENELIVKNKRIQ